MAKPDLEKSEETITLINNSNTECTPKQVVEKASEHPEWLPDGWTVDFRTRKSGAHKGSGYKCYIDPLKKHKFYSKPEVLRYLETTNDNSCTHKKENKCPIMKSVATVKDSSCTPDKEKKCPNTWSLETLKDKSCIPKEEECSNTHSIEAVKENCCTPGKGKKCPKTHSLETVEDNSCTPKKEKKLHNRQSLSNVVIEKSIAEDLPPGWIKEVRIRQTSNGLRKDPFYTDPVDGYVFRSKRDVMRYITSGDITTCANKPSRIQVLDEDKLLPSSAAKRKKLEQSAPKQQLFAGKATLDKSSLELADANSSREGLDVSVQSGMPVASVPASESVVNIHSLEDGAENLPEMWKKSDPGRKNDDMQEKEHVEDMMENANEKNPKEHVEDMTENANEKNPKEHVEDMMENANEKNPKEHVEDMMENANEKNPGISSISKSKKGVNVCCRSSPRLAGIQPVQLATTVISEQTLQVPKTRSRKSRTTLNVDLENTSSHHFHGVPETELEHKNHQVVINTDKNISEDQANKIETDKIVDQKPEIHTKTNKLSDKREHKTTRRTSKRLAGFDRELMNNSVSLEKTLKYESEKSGDRVNAELQQSEDEPATVLADHAPINGDLANKRRKSSEIPPVVTDDPRAKLIGGEMDDEKSDPQMSFAFHYSWSDPSLENAISTLTSVLPVENSVYTGPTTLPRTDSGKKLVDDVTGSSRNRNPQVRSNKSKKKELKVPMRVSKRLAGLEPESTPSERALEYAPKRSCKKEPTATEISVEGASDHLDIEEDIKLECQASPNLRSEVLGELSNKSDKSHDALTVPGEQLQKTEVLRESSNKSDKSCDTQNVPKEELQNVESENTVNERSEPQFPITFGDSWSDPCLDFAFKTLTGALPFDAATNMLPIITPDLNDPPNMEFYGGAVTSNSEEAQDKPIQSQKECRMVIQQPSEPLLRQLELGTSSTSCEHATEITTRESCGDESCITKNVDGEPVHVDARNITPHVHYSRNVNPLIHKEPVQESRQVRKSEPILTDQPPPGFESQSCTSFMNSWSDPCLEFAFKTLTGVIPVKENFASPGCFQQPANCHDRRDEGNFAIPGCFQQPANCHDQRDGENFAIPGCFQQPTSCHDRRDGVNFAIPGCFQQPTNCHDRRDGENFAIPGCFQQPTDCHDRRDGSSTLPQFGSSSFSRSDNPFYYDIDVNSMPGQQSSRSFLFQSLEKPNLQGCPEVAPQNQYSQFTKNFQRQQNHCNGGRHL